MIKIKQYYFKYNREDGKYYVEESYPLKSKANKENKVSNTSEENVGNNLGLNSLLQNAPIIIETLPKAWGLLKQFIK